jgi:hypothetical protein
MKADRRFKSLFRSEKHDYVKSAGGGVLRRLPVAAPVATYAVEKFVRAVGSG